MNEIVGTLNRRGKTGGGVIKEEGAQERVLVDKVYVLNTWQPLTGALIDSFKRYPFLIVAFEKTSREHHTYNALSVTDRMLFDLSNCIINIQVQSICVLLTSYRESGI